MAAGPSKAISVAPAPTAEYLWPSVPQVGHNAHALYSPDNDFEVFIDVSGTTQYYVEVEISLQNATYDIRTIYVRYMYDIGTMCA